MEKYIGLTNANNLSQVIRMVNETRTEYNEAFTAEYLAAQYAFEGALENGYGFDQDQLEAQLEALREAGGQFDNVKAVFIAKEFAQSENSFMAVESGDNIWIVAFTGYYPSDDSLAYANNEEAHNIQALSEEEAIEEASAIWGIDRQTYC